MPMLPWCIWVPHETTSSTWRHVSCSDHSESLRLMLISSSLPPWMSLLVGFKLCKCRLFIFPLLFSLSTSLIIIVCFLNDRKETFLSFFIYFYWNSRRLNYLTTRINDSDWIRYNQVNHTLKKIMLYYMICDIWKLKRYLLWDLEDTVFICIFSSYYRCWKYK